MGPDYERAAMSMNCDEKEEQQGSCMTTHLLVLR